MMKKKYIDLDEIIATSSSGFLKKLPSQLVDLMKILIRQERINHILNKYESYEGLEFIRKLNEEFKVKVEYTGLENLPENGRCFFAANHPFGFLDGLILTKTVGEKYGNFKAIGNEAFMLAPQLRPVIAAVNVFGTNPRQYIIELEKVFESDIAVTHFPAGVVSRMKKGIIEDSEWHKSFISRAVKSKRDIVPFYFFGRNSNLFYGVFLLRKMLRISLNLELALLPHEIFNKQNKTIRVKIGKPIPWQTFDKSKSHYDWAQYVKQEVYKLRYPN